MAALIYSALTSLDGYVNDLDGGFAWAEPEPEVHQHVNDLERSIGTCLYGRRMHEVMRFWQTAGTRPDDPAVERDYAAIWRAAEKVVYSTTLTAVDTPRTRLVTAFDPAEVRQLVDAADRDVSIGGPGLGRQALTAGIVDEIRLYLAPVVVGGGTAFLPGGRLDLELLDQRRFPGGTVYLRYRVTR